jgi:hemoglobin
VSEAHRDHVTTWWSEVFDGPADPEFRAALVGYLEWGTRLAMHNSRTGAEVAAHAPVPRWGWGVAPRYRP